VLTSVPIWFLIYV